MPDQAAVYALRQDAMADSNRSAAEQIGRLSQQVETLTKDVEVLQGDVKKLVAAWAAADSLVTLVKWAAALVVGAVAIYATAKQWFLAK